MTGYALYEGDCLDILPTLEAGSVHCSVTSPPYFGLRDYGVDGQIGLEESPEAYVEKLVRVFREVRRVLRDDGTVWLNLGDSYNGSGTMGSVDSKQGTNVGSHAKPATKVSGLKPKDLIGIPWRVAFALQADGWYLRSDIIWHKPNPMPESVTDRCTKAHEYIFLLSKSARYYYDAEAVKEEATDPEYRERGKIRPTAEGGKGFEIRGGLHNQLGGRTTRNRRSVWTVATQPFKGSHFATFPPKLIEPCVLAGTSEKGCCAECGAPWERVVKKEWVKHPNGLGNGTETKDLQQHQRGVTSAFRTGGSNVATTTGWQPTCTCNAADPIPATVLDPFNGAGTTGVVALQNGRRYVGVELNPEYLEMARQRIDKLATVKPAVTAGRAGDVNGLPMFGGEGVTA